MEKKEITARTTIKAIITGFVSYGMITMIICYCISAILGSALDKVQGSSARGLYITLPLMAVIIIYCIAHMVCRMSTYDVFKKCKTNPDNYKKINKFLIIFFITIIIFSIVTFLGLLALNLKYQLQSIELARLRYMQIFSNEHVNMLTDKMETTYNASRTNLTMSTVILVIGCAVSFLSLIPYQKEMITKYNEF